MLLRLRVQPRSSRDEVVGIHGDSIRIRLTAPPVDGGANEALVRFLAGKLHVSPATIRLDQGHSGRNKLVTILGAEVHQVTTGLGVG